MKIGDYVIVTNIRGSYSGTVEYITLTSITVKCSCCRLRRVEQAKHVKVSKNNAN